jgi:hypothetical protein
MISAVLELGKGRKLAFQKPDIALSVFYQRFRRVVPGNLFLVLAVGTGLHGHVVDNLQFKDGPVIAGAAFVSEQHVSFSSLWKLQIANRHATKIRWSSDSRSGMRNTYHLPNIISRRSHVNSDALLDRLRVLSKKTCPDSRAGRMNSAQADLGK